MAKTKAGRTADIGTGRNEYPIFPDASCGPVFHQYGSVDEPRGKTRPGINMKSSGIIPGTATTAPNGDVGGRTA